VRLKGKANPVPLYRAQWGISTEDGRRAENS